jgi:hypothetical protein
MSKPNKANRSNYIQAGRLTPDDLARERQKQRLVKDPGMQETPHRRRQGLASRIPAAARKTNRTAG